MDDSEGYYQLIKGCGNLFLDGLGIIAKAVYFFYLLIILLLILHIIKSIGLSKLSDNTKDKVLSWFPILNNGVLTKKTFDKYAIGIIISICLLFGFNIISNEDYFIKIIGIICILIYFITYICACYTIYEKYSNNYKKLTLLTLFSLGLFAPFIFLKLGYESHNQLKTYKIILIISLIIIFLLLRRIIFILI